MKRVHFVGVGGVAMGTLACALARSGYQVSGSDGALYEPMRSVIAGAGIQVFDGFHAETAEKLQSEVEQVIIGNVVSKENPEARQWIAQHTPFVSFPEAVRRFLIEDRRSIVCSGTHGKTTTTSWVAFLFKELGLDPSYLIGGVPKDLEAGCQLTQGDYFVGEGDEYDSAFFDKGPKFLHYHPHILIVSNIEFDHADIYADLDEIKRAFRKLISLLPGTGLCIANYDDPNVMELATDALCPVETFGLTEGAMWRIQVVEENQEGFHFQLHFKGKLAGQFQTPLFGKYNLMNLTSGIIAATNCGVPLEKIRPIVPRFRGAKRRQDHLLTEPITLIDDFAHHPTEVRATLWAVRRRYPEGKLWALFEPRSATACKNVHQQEYVQAFDKADRTLISAPYRKKNQNDPEQFSPQTLVTNLKSNQQQAEAFEDPQALLAHFLKEVQKGDVAVVMSNGEFGKIQGKIVTHFS